MLFANYGWNWLSCFWKDLFWMRQIYFHLSQENCVACLWAKTYHLRMHYGKFVWNWQRNDEEEIFLIWSLCFNQFVTLWKKWTFIWKKKFPHLKDGVCQEGWNCSSVSGEKQFSMTTTTIGIPIRISHMHEPLTQANSLKFDKWTPPSYISFKIHVFVKLKNKISPVVIFLIFVFRHHDNWHFSMGNTPWLWHDCEEMAMSRLLAALINAVVVLSNVWSMRNLYFFAGSSRT